MSKVLHLTSDGQELKKLPEMKRLMEQDALTMQGVSSRLQIKEEQRRLSKHPVPVESTAKRLSKPSMESDFISAPLGIGRMSKERVAAMKMESFTKDDAGLSLL